MLCSDCRNTRDGPQGNWSQNLRAALKLGIEVTVSWGAGYCSVESKARTFRVSKRKTFGANTSCGNPRGRERGGMRLGEALWISARLPVTPQTCKSTFAGTPGGDGSVLPRSVLAKRIFNKALASSPFRVTNHLHCCGTPIHLCVGNFPCLADSHK